ncbi:MAG TPA: hypothetical protein VKO42_01865 [Patescibacteria group bacterium]|nr:hypothetical protein [Patescibacteria group bacterium]
MSKTQFFKSLKEVRDSLCPCCRAVVVRSGRGFFIHGEPLNLNKDINPGAQHQKHRLKLWEAGAKKMYGEQNVAIAGGPDN